MDGIDPTDETALAVYYQTHPLTHRLSARVVAASVLAALLGAYTTLLLLGRRTAARGWRNWALLVLAATTEASVGIWCTSFCRRRAWWRLTMSSYPLPRHRRPRRQ